MSTYNGFEYVDDQIQSIINQTYTNWHLYIRDDGSSDNTLSKLRNYEKSDERIHVLIDGNNLGPRDSFMNLLESINADYYFFSDQDDKWLPDKVELCLNYMLRNDNRKKPLLIFTDVIPTDSNLVPDSISLWERYNLNPYLYDNPKIALINPIALGMTMCFNDQLKKHAFPINPSIGMHDSWIFYIAVKFGKLLPINHPTVLYRQHSKNVCGIYDKNKLSIKQHVIDFNTIIKKNIYRFRRLNRIEHISIINYLNCKVRILISRYFYKRR